MNWKNLEGASIADNPCWGGPEPHRHDLQYLLRVLGGGGGDCNNFKSDSNDDDITDDAFPSSISASSHAALMDQVVSRLVIHNDDNYIAIDKPADLRMDGPHRATVHKLLLYLYPPPSLLQTMKDTATDELRRHEHLLKSIAPLTNSSDLKDDPFRTVHQLDYATSGVLLMGKNRKAAGTACISFQERRAKKTYVAVVTTDGNGISDLPFGKEFFESMPALPKSSLKPWAAGSLEKQYRKKRRRDTDGKDTFNGYMPEHAIFAKWRGYVLKKKKMEGVDAQKDGKVVLHANNEDVKQQSQDNMTSQLIQSKTQHLTPQDIDELLSIGPSWKKVKAHCDGSAKDNICSWPSTVERMTKEYNQSAATAANPPTADEDEANNETIKTEQSSSFPPLFRIHNEESDSFYICASIGGVGDGRFDVLVDPSAALTSTQSNSPSVLREMKPSLTRCTVLWRGYLHEATTTTAAKGEGRTRVPVAKVLLSPWTGRRHQLRVHLSRVAGCPILGDVHTQDESKIEVS
ncbi:hypothetical protein ACHAXM_007185 [Skeletonema potamos]